MAETDRRIITLPYGEGLERSKGIMVVNPTTFDDLRNVFQFDGKAQVRRGLTLASVLVDDQANDLDVTVMLEPLRSLSASMGVGYATASREVWLNRLAIDGTSPIEVGQLGTLGGDATFVPPVIIGADSDNKFFIAHDEPKLTARFVTQVFDPEGSPQLSPLKADLDGTSGDRDVFFRGVVRHLSYIFGWGFGNVQDPNRGDVVRVSNSGDSRVFEDFAFFEAGQQGETVMVCRSAGPTLSVFKETETYEIFGYSPDTFGIRLADSLFGCVGSRLAVSIAGTVFFWSTQGPRLTSGGPSIDIAVPLDLDGPDPATLVAESDPQDAFAAYDPRTRVVQFVWGRRVYALSIRDPNRPRWSYYELGERAQSSGLFFSTQSQAGGGGPPQGAPEIDTFDEEARGTLTFASNANNNETMRLNNKDYLWQSILTDIDGNIQIGANAAASAANMIAAVTLTGTPGVDYAASMTINSDLTAGPGTPVDSVEVSGRLGQGFAGNGQPLLETMSGASFDTPVTANGIGNTATFVEFFLFNTGVILGGESIEVHVSTDGGATYSFSGRFPADGSVPPDRQKLRVELESRSSGRSIQPLTDYKFSIRYILGGQFSPGYESTDPDDWPAASQGLTTTIADALVLSERVGENEGLWETLRRDEQQFNIRTEIPDGHELLDIEVFVEVQEAGQGTDPDGFSGPARGTVTQAEALRAIYNAGSPGYPARFEDFHPLGEPDPSPRSESLNLYRMRFRKGGNFGNFSNQLECFGGPDAQPDDSIFFAQLGRTGIFGIFNTIELRWDNTDTPDGTAEQGGLRVCPTPNAAGVPPRNHSTQIYARNASTGSSWERIATVAAFTTNYGPAIFDLTGGVGFGQTIRFAIRHRVRCFPGILTGGRHESEWALQGGGLRFISRVTST